MGKKRGSKKKVSHENEETLPWKQVDYSRSDADRLGMNFLGTGVEVLSFEELPASSYTVMNGKIVMKNDFKPDRNLERDTGETQALVGTDVENVAEEEVPPEEDHVFTIDKDMSAWEDFGLHRGLLAGLSKLGFTVPTPIQQLCIRKGLNGMDVLGAAETGSGKTLAFGIPLLNELLNKPMRKSDGLAALILSPTRELAVQIASHLGAVLSVYNEVARKKIKVAQLLGGMSQIKQERILSTRPDILVATPGRLWALICEGNPHLSSLVNTLRFLVVDEADRMFESGHFPDLKQFFIMLEKGMKEKSKYKRQTLLFSATLLLKNKRTFSKSKKGKAPSEVESGLEFLMDLFEKIGCRGKPALCTVSAHEQMDFWSLKKNTEEEERTNTNTNDTIADEERRKDEKSEKLKSAISIPEGLTLSTVKCVESAKDNYVYYFLMKFPGRSVIFVNTIAVLRRVANILKILQVPNVHSLHANMQQRQRLKHLENFTNLEQGVLVATDVAARGLDIKGIKYVIHYSIPKTVDMFVHRSGRTARAMSIGLCLALVAPADLYAYQKVECAIGEDRFESFPIDMTFMPKLKQRVALAHRIEILERKQNQSKADQDWFRLQAEAADLPFDDDFAQDVRKKKSVAFDDGRVKECSALKKQLENMLKEKIVPHFASTKYIATDANHARFDLNQEIISGKRKSPIEELKTNKIKRSKVKPEVPGI